MPPTPMKPLPEGPPPLARHERSYRHTIWRGEGNASRLSAGWYARLNIKKGGQISRKEVGPFSEEKKAAAYLAKATGIAVSALRLRVRTPVVAAATAGKDSKVSTYKYVAYHKKKGGWVVQVYHAQREKVAGQRSHKRKREKVAGQRSRKCKHAKVVTFCGPFPDQLTAAQKAAALSGIPVSHLRKKKERCVAHLAELRRRQAVIVRVYRLLNAQTLEVPGDLEATVEHAHKSRRMFQEMPALELVSILGKYAPWKDGLLTAYHHVQSQGHRSQVTGDGVERSARLLWRVCMMALQSNANHVDEFAPWIKHVGRNMARCSGSYYQVHTPSISLVLPQQPPGNSFSTTVLGVQ